MTRITRIEVTIEVRPEKMGEADGAWATIKFGDEPIFEEYVYDNADTNPAEENVLKVFRSRLGKFIDPERYA
jgi:hypothetical protein